VELNNRTNKRKRITNQPMLLLIPDRGRFLGDLPDGGCEEPFGEGFDIHCSGELQRTQALSICFYLRKSTPPRNHLSHNIKDRIIQPVFRLRKNLPLYHYPFSYPKRQPTPQRSPRKIFQPMRNLKGLAWESALNW